MKISKLYIKIFLSVLLGLILAETLMFSAFRGIYRHDFRRDVGEIVDAHAVLIRSYVETRLASGRTLQQATVELAAIVPGDVWALDAQNRVVASSVPQLAPPDIDDFDRERETHEGVRLDFEDDALLALLPLAIDARGRPGRLLFEFRKGDRDGPGEKPLALALAGVAVAFAMLLYPLSRLLGRPLRELRSSVLRIADGDLNHRVQIRSHDEIGELGHAFNQMADRVERMVDGTRELTAHVSHELRSPLARIRVAAELLHENPGADGSPENVSKRETLHDSIHEEIEDLDRLIGRILELSRLDFGAHSNPPEPRSTAELLAQLNELAVRYRPAFERRNLDLSIMLPGYGGGEAIPPVALSEDVVSNPESLAGVFSRGAANTRLAFSPADLQTVVSVLLDNALKYARSATVIKAHLVRKKSETPSLWIEISNNLPEGSKLDPKRIFEPFQRGESHRDQEGSGLGLTIAQKVVQNAGGSIKANYGDGRKILFEIRLPLE